VVVGALVREGLGVQIATSSFGLAAMPALSYELVQAALMRAVRAGVT
jgi:hypothetical protein